MTEFTRESLRAEFYLFLPEEEHVARSGNESREMAKKKTTRNLLALKKFDAEYFRERKVDLLGGIDEAGRGALAGPVVAAVAVVDPEFWVEGLNDSKQLSQAKREALYPQVCSRARAVGIGWATAEEVDRINVLEATLLSAQRALEVIAAEPELLLTDFLKLKGTTQPVEPLVKGDARSQAIAAASVVAKVTRDRMMRLLDAEYPEYGFAGHKGYGAAKHVEALGAHGSSTVHRHSFNGVDWFDQEYCRSVTFRRLLGEIEKGEIALDGLDDLLRGPAYLLPEYEERLLRQALDRLSTALGTKEEAP